MSLPEFIATHGVKSMDSAAQGLAKKKAAEAALELVEDGMVIGLGTGSTVRYFLEGLAQRVKQGLKVEGVPTSIGTEAIARELGVPLLGAGDYARLDNDLCVDGADRVDNSGHLIKGGGGALLREKLVASRSRRVAIMVDATKLEPVFSDSFPLPVECLPFGRQNTLEELVTTGCRAALRRNADGEYLVTDNGNNIVDCSFDSIPEPAALQARIKSIVGVMEVGLFVNLMDTLILGRPEGALLWPSA